MAKIRRNLLRLTLGLVLLTGVAEVGLRLLGLGNPLLQMGDKDCDYLFQPNQQTTRFFKTNHLNQFSQRSEDVAAEKPAGTYRILMIGDSVLYGTTYVDQSRIFSTQIQQQLSAKLHQPVQVLNASCGGWATGNELGYLTSRGTFQADMVVFVNNTGDFDVVKNVIGMTGSETKPSCALAELWSHYISPRIFHAPPAVDSGSVASGTGKEVYERTDAVLANIKAAKDFANDHNAGFAVLFSPALGGSWDAPGYLWGYGKMQVFLEANDIPLVDMTPEFKQIPYAKLYDSGNIHLNPIGHDLVAKTFVDAVPQLQTSIAQQMQPHRPSLASATP